MLLSLSKPVEITIICESLVKVFWILRLNLKSERMSNMETTVKPVENVEGRIRVPGDKSFLTGRCSSSLTEGSVELRDSLRPGIPYQQ